MELISYEKSGGIWHYLEEISSCFTFARDTMKRSCDTHITHCTTQYPPVSDHSCNLIVKGTMLTCKTELSSLLNWCATHQEPTAGSSLVDSSNQRSKVLVIAFTHRHVESLLLTTETAEQRHLEESQRSRKWTTISNFHLPLSDLCAQTLNLFVTRSKICNEECTDFCIVKCIEYGKLSNHAQPKQNGAKINIKSCVKNYIFWFKFATL